MLTPGERLAPRPLPDLSATLAARAASRLHACRVLDLGDCRGIGAEALRTALATPPAMSSLERLGLAGLAELDDQLLGDVLLTIPGLLHLDLSHCRCNPDPDPYPSHP